MTSDPTSGPILTGHPVLRFAHQLTARLEQVACLPRVVDES